MNRRTIVASRARNYWVDWRLRLRDLVLAAAVILATGTAANALDECSGVPRCVSVPDVKVRGIPRNTVGHFDIKCQKASASDKVSALFMWNWHVMWNRHAVETRSHSRMVDISLVRLHKDKSGRDNGIRLRIDNSDEKQPTIIQIKLGCSAKSFPYVNAGRKTHMSIHPNNMVR